MKLVNKGHMVEELDGEMVVFYYIGYFNQEAEEALVDCANSKGLDGNSLFYEMTPLAAGQLWIKSYDFDEFNRVNNV